ncbi:transcriptional-regulating factor 1 isoform X6 [Pieris brassicae]|uniref:transcriptional-regulating factor 1 isoform X6 n=1 Tax=Pieris brassicae TaxID=7116 RepID=UPI001E661DAA|nr:transcriptional-regulating factor 1 isoform X6 [Pieris brassicae]
MGHNLLFNKVMSMLLSSHPYTRLTSLTWRVATSRLPLPRFSPRAVLMYSAAVGGEGVALQLREATPAEIDARLDERLAIACHEPELLADLLHAAVDIGEHDGLNALLGATSPEFALASDASDSLPLPDIDRDCKTPSLSVDGITTVSVAVTGIDSRPLARPKIRPKPASPNRQGPQQCQVCNKVFGNASALAKHKLTHSDERKYVCITCAKAFKRQDHLNGHMLTHRNKKPYECKADGCGKSYCDARSLRRHTENHHHPDKNGSKESANAEREATARVASPTSPARALHSDTSNGSEKSSITNSSGDSTPPRTPPTQPVPVAQTMPPNAVRPKPKPVKPKSLTLLQHASPKCGSGNTINGIPISTSICGTISRSGDAKPVECNLCHRKFKNIPALNGHMRLHGGYFKKDSDNKKLDKKESTGPPLQTASVSVRALIEEKIISRRGATTSQATGVTDSTSRSGFATPAPPPLSSIRTSASPVSPATTSVHFVSPKVPPVVTLGSNVANTTGQRDSTLIELLKKGNSKVEEALEEVLPDECRALDVFTLNPSPTARRMMLNSEDPLLSSSPRDFPHSRAMRRQRSATPIPTSLHQWQSENNSLQVCVEGREGVPAVFLSPNSIPPSPQRRKRKASPAGPHRSRMRRAPTHYTPQPLLSPDRDGPGLYVDFISGISGAEAEVLSQFEDNQTPRINIGAEHQADIPELCSDRVDLHRVPEQLLWDPGINDALDDNEVRMFMELAMCAAMPVGGHTREFALQTLGECGGDIRAATLRLMSRPPAPAQHEARWTPDEVEAFLNGLAHYDKDFYRISQLIRTKDSKQCVQFYYFWKKVTKDYKTLYLRSWSDARPPQGTFVHAPSTSSPTSFEGEEYPCKICGKVFNKVKSRSAHMKSHRPLDAEPKRPKLEKPYEKVEADERSQATAEYKNRPHYN